MKTTPGHLSSQNAEETINKLNNLVDLTSENDLNLLKIEINKTGKNIILVGQDYTYCILLDESKYDFIEMLKKNKFDDLEDMVCRLQITNKELLDIHGLKYIPLSTIGYTLPPGFLKS